MRVVLFRNISRLGFTLIELLVVMAITVILLGLIFGPLVQGFNLTNRARVQVLTQDTARQAMELIQRDMSNGVFVFDEAPAQSQLVINPPYPPTGNPEIGLANAVSLWIRDGSGNVQRMLIPFGMTDFVPPGRLQDQNATVPAVQIDPTTGLAIDRGSIATPLAPGRVMIRYFLGLRNNASTHDLNIYQPPDFPGGLPGGYGVLTGWPILPYGNYYDDISTFRLDQHNPIALFRAVFSPYMPNPGKAGQVQVDKRLFHFTVAPNGSEVPILYDPNFWYDDSPAQTVLLANGNVTNMMDGWRDDNGDGVVNICENWRALARSIVPTDRADEIVLARDTLGKAIYDAVTRLPRVSPQVRFQPTYVGNDAGNPTNFSDAGNEMPNLSPSAYAETNGAWTVPYRLYVYRSPLNAALLQYFYETGNGDIRYQEFSVPGNMVTLDQTANFTLVPYTEPAPSNQRYRALQAGVRPSVMFWVDTRRGLVNFAFPSWIVLHDPAGQRWPSTFAPNEPNQHYTDAVNMTLDGYRYVSLATMDQTLNPPLMSGFRPPLEIQPDGRTYVPNVRIVPGSEVVKGPDMIRGPHYGQEITYTRVPRNSDPKMIGPNEYMINYVDIEPNSPDPLRRAGTIIFDSQKDLDTQPNFMIPDGKPRKHWLPAFRYEDGDNNPDTPATLTLPAVQLTATYQMQNNLPTDIVKADYLTRQLMTVGLGVRLYDFRSGQPQQVTLTQKIKVRNLQR